MNNVARIRQQLVEKDLDALLITDEKNQRYAAGFPITDGAVLVTREKAYLITDSRYIEAAERAVDDCVTVQLYDGQHPLLARLAAALKENNVQRLGAEEQTLSHGGWTAYQKRLGLELRPAQEILRTLRASKNEEEIACMIRAQRISEKALEYSDFYGNALFRKGQLRDLFADPANGDYTLREDAPVYTFAPAFEPLPLSEMGRQS